MATNVSKAYANGKYSGSFVDVGSRMRAFDNFPQEVRRALTNANGDWSIQQCHIMLHGGDKKRGIAAHTPASLVRLIEFNDKRRA